MTAAFPATRDTSADRHDRTALRLRLVSIALLSAALSCIIVLHFIRSDLAPARHRISEYALGPHGEVMAIGFVCLGAGVLALAWPLARSVAPWSRLVLVVVTASGVGMVVSGIFRTDPQRSGVTTDAIHSYASAFSTMALIGTALLCSLGSRAPAPRLPRIMVALAFLGAILGALSPFLHHSSWTGVSQRLLWLTLLAWLILTAVGLPTRSTK